jgi:hypothetical protein
LNHAGAGHPQAFQDRIQGRQVRSVPDRGVVTSRTAGAALREQRRNFAFILASATVLDANREGISGSGGLEIRRVAPSVFFPAGFPLLSPISYFTLFTLFRKVGATSA